MRKIVEKFVGGGGRYDVCECAKNTVTTYFARALSFSRKCRCPPLIPETLATLRLIVIGNNEYDLSLSLSIFCVLDAESIAISKWRLTIILFDILNGRFVAP